MAVPLFTDVALLKRRHERARRAGADAAVRDGGPANAFLLERAQFRGKSALSLLMLAPLVIPGVILGIRFAFASRPAQPPTICGDSTSISCVGLPLSSSASFPHLVDRDADDRRAAQALRRHARRRRVQPGRVARGLLIVVLPQCPALIGAAAISFLMSFENFNDADARRLRSAADGHDVRPMREGASPVLNAVSLLLMVASALVALALLHRSSAASRSRGT
jgi:spermidine/putrescine transport system permease protein